MVEHFFKFENCLLKHYIRKKAWLPVCRKQLQKVRKSDKRKKYPRRLKYFTFCAVGALDVLLLHREKVLKQSKSDLFDTVVFFDKSSELVAQTHRRIPGAIGYPGDFIDIVLLPDGGEPEAFDFLGAPEGELNVRETRVAQRRQDMRRQFVRDFPFDVINLDIERYLFIPSEDLPGKLVNALRNIFEWQKRTGVAPSGKDYVVTSFALLFTARIGPDNLSDDYLTYLASCIQRNIDEHQDLQEEFENRANGQSVQNYFDSDFGGAFKLSVPKSLSDLALECDWYIDGDAGISVYEFERQLDDQSYRMLHMVMFVNRQDPDASRRGPGEPRPAAALESHGETLRGIFTSDAVDVGGLVSGSVEEELKSDLQKLFQHRDKFCPSDNPAAAR